VLWADFSTALGDVTHAKAVLFLRALLTIAEHIEWVHIELCDTDEEARSSEGLLVLFVVADYVTCVLAQEAFNALTELL